MMTVVLYVFPFDCGNGLGEGTDGTQDWMRELQALIQNPWSVCFKHLRAG